MSMDSLNDYVGHRPRTPLPSNDLRPPSYGGPQRDAINSVVDGVVNDICAKIAELRKQLDAIEQQVLESAADTKHHLQDHVSICVRINDEITHMKDVVAEISDAGR